MRTMPFRSDAIAEFVFLVVMACWLGFGVILIVGRKGAAKSPAKQDIKSHAGFALQSLAYAVLFTFPRTYFSPIAPVSGTVEGIIGAAVVAIAVGSDWF